KERLMTRTTHANAAEPTGAVALAEAGRKYNRHDGAPQADIRALMRGLHVIRVGDFELCLPDDGTGYGRKLADTYHAFVDDIQQMAQELKRVGHVFGKECKPRERANFAHSKGAWGEMEVSVNTLVDDLLRPTTEVTRAIAAVAQGDLRQTVRLDVDGRPLEG